jgi:hypothetical protein
MTQELFDDSIDHAEWQYAYPALFNNQIWSKYALGHITNDVRALFCCLKGPFGC